MILNRYEDVTIVNADKDKYLVLKGVDNSEELIGNPVRIIFSNENVVPELEERDLANSSRNGE